MTFRIFEQSYYSYSLLRSEREDHKLLGIIGTCSNRSLSHSFRYGQERFLGRAIPVYLNVLLSIGFIFTPCSLVLLCCNYVQISSYSYQSLSISFIILQIRNTLHVSILYILKLRSRWLILYIIFILPQGINTIY